MIVRWGEPQKKNQGKLDMVSRYVDCREKQSLFSGRRESRVGEEDFVCKICREKNGEKVSPDFFGERKREWTKIESNQVINQIDNI